MVILILVVSLSACNNIRDYNPFVGGTWEADTVEGMMYYNFYPNGNVMVTMHGEKGIFKYVFSDTHIVLMGEGNASQTYAYEFVDKDTLLINKRGLYYRKK